MVEKTMLEDGYYHSWATVHIKDGNALVILHDTFDLPSGTTIPLLRKEHNLRVGLSDIGEVGLYNGHSII